MSDVLAAPPSESGSINKLSRDVRVVVVAVLVTQYPPRRCRRVYDAAGIGIYDFVCGGSMPVHALKEKRVKLLMPNFFLGVH